MNDFETWWHLEGSTSPVPGEDGDGYCKRICQIAWSNGAFKEREACARLAEWEPCMTDTPKRIAAAIRARGNT